MAQAPNYYFNSPWIADAARNLASALRPPDPRELLERERSKWQFERDQQLAREADEQHVKDVAANEALGVVATMDQAVNPLTGEIDYEQTGKNMRRAAAPAYAGGYKYIEPTNELLGPYAQSFEADLAIAAARADAQERAIAQRGEQQMRYGQFVQGQINDRQSNLFGHQFQMEAFKQTGRFQLLNAGAQHRLAEIRERARVAGGDPEKINGQALEDLITLMEEKITSTGQTMPNAYHGELLARMAIIASQNGGNVPLAVQQGWEEAGLPEGDVQEPEQPGPIARFFGAKPVRQLKPNFSTPRQPGQTPTPAVSTDRTTSFSGVLAPGAENRLPVDLAPPGMSQGAYDAALNRSMQTGKPPDFSNILAPTPAPAAAAPAAAPATAPAPADTPPPPPPKPAQGKGKNSGLPKPKTKAEFDALPKGTRFIDPKGEIRVKP